MEKLRQTHYNRIESGNIGQFLFLELIICIILILFLHPVVQFQNSWKIDFLCIRDWIKWLNL